MSRDNILLRLGIKIYRGKEGGIFTTSKYVKFWHASVITFKTITYAQQNLIIEVPNY